MLIIFSGFNQRAVIAALRALEKNQIKDYTILACGRNDSILRTSYANKVYHIREHNELYKTELYGLFEKIVSENEGSKVVVVPSTEGLNRFLLENREEIETLGITIPLVDNLLYEKISNKHTFWELCRNCGLKVPEIVSIRDEYEFRYVAKPIAYLTPSGKRLIPIIVDSKDKHSDFLENFEMSDFDIQEFVDGESIYLLYYLSRTGENYSFSQRNLVQQPGGKSIVAALSWNTHNEPISNEYIRLLRDIGYFGFIMVELRKKDGQYFMIEANPRMWGPSQLYVDAGIIFIEAFLHDYGVLDEIPKRKVCKRTAYYWSGGISHPLLEDTNCVWLDKGKEIVNANLDLIYESDIYRRSDTINMFNDEREAWRERR